MAIAGIDPKCYILALFVRDDGVRFLLGDDPYEFKDKQLHFQPNTVANDVVEVQGNDGYLLAGQVRRPGTQSFDGYVCNGTNSKAEVEIKRREFLQFFRRSHFYKVIYVFPNGTAIQRKQGFLVDDPTVQELYQQYPEYHVALNFEDVNYYTYEEDDQGQEIYAKEAIVPLAGGGATGGLIWDEYGVVWDGQWSDLVSVSGSEIQIDNDAGARAPIQDLELQGDTYQQTYSGKNLINYTSYNGKSGIGTVTLADGKVKIEQSETGGGNCYVYFDVNRPDLANQQVTFYAKGISGGGSTGTRVRFTQISTSTENAPALFPTSDGASITFTVPSNGEMRFYFYANASNVPGAIGAYSEYSEIQLELGSTSSAFEPYTGGIPAPSPDFPELIQVVTGEQTVTVTEDGGVSQSYIIDLGTTELCKIGDYQDEIFNNDPNEDWYDPDLEDNAWYVHKEVGKYADLANLSWHNASEFSSGVHGYWTSLAGFETPKMPNPPCYCSHWEQVAYHSGVTRPAFMLGGTGSTHTIVIGTTISSTASDFATWLRNNQVFIYYPLATPTDTKITDATLVGQLEALGTMKLFIGENNVIVGATDTNLPATLAFDYYSKFTTIGAEWEEGGTKGATIVDVDAIDNTYPVWELTGPATNPTLSVLTTNTTLTYNGTITASQKLVIDMFNKTATLNGTSVIGNVSGDFVYMAPGTNRIAYTAGNTDAPDSTIYWQEVVG